MKNPKFNVKSGFLFVFFFLVLSPLFFIFQKQNSRLIFKVIAKAQVADNPWPPGPVSGEANGDGHVDGVDYVIWLNNYGK